MGSMMVIDSSAWVAMILGEDDAEKYSHAIGAAIARSERIYIPASVIVEAGVVLDRKGKVARFDALLETLQPEFVALDGKAAASARAAYAAFGKGIHPAGLNFGDCMSYATCAVLGETLLFKGNDFPQTDITSALH